MFANSSPVSSDQNSVHTLLATLVEKHARNEFRKPIMQYNLQAFELGMRTWQTSGAAPLILDAGCGVGLSTMSLATRYPDHFVIGVDQSDHRLGRQAKWGDGRPSNYLCLRADLVDFWRLLQTSRVQLARHYLLYPNPWPKPAHLRRRWHAHSVFPAVVALGGHFECRSNWRIYVDECAAALMQLTGIKVSSEPYLSNAPITPFERKYIASGHSLWRCRCSVAH